MHSAEDLKNALFGTSIFEEFSHTTVPYNSSRASVFEWYTRRKQQQLAIVRKLAFFYQLTIIGKMNI